MKAPITLALLAASISAQTTSPTSITPSATLPTTRTSTSFSTETAACSTLKGPQPLVLDFFGTKITTSLQFTYTFTQNTTYPASTYYSQRTVVVTRNATTVTSVVTATQTATVTSTRTPAVVTVLPSPGWLPLRGTPLPSPSPSAGLPPRIRGLSYSPSSPSALFARDNEPITKQIGWIADPATGKRVPIERTWYTLAIFCPVRITPYEVLYVTQVDATSVQAATGIAVATTTVTTTVTTGVVAPTPTYHAACGPDNIVNHLDYDNNGQKLYFDRVYYRRGSGNNTDVNEVGVDAVNEYDCCVRCQEAPEGCSEAFFIPTEQKCQLRLRLPPSSPSSLPSFLPSASGLVPVPTGTSNPVCPAGSLTEWVGVIRGQECFRPDFAWYFINGPCGRLSVDSVPVDRVNGTASSCSLVPSGTGTGTGASLGVATPTGMVGRRLSG